MGLIGGLFATIAAIAALSGATSAITGAVGASKEQENREKEYQFQAEQAQTAREFASVEAQKNREYQTAMSNTAYQRSVADMEKAGINPALLGGSSISQASTPIGGQAAATSAQGGVAPGNTALNALVTASAKTSAAHSNTFGKILGGLLK